MDDLRFKKKIMLQRLIIEFSRKMLNASFNAVGGKRLDLDWIDEYPEKILAEIEKLEIEDFEKNHIKNLETAYSEKFGGMPF
jgi:hypothetical protein